jgi:glycosyl transferase family 2
MLWSILICTLARREEKFLKLLGQLLPQVEESSESVEVVALQNQGELRLDRYRERLLEDARGEYLCFVDDDDWVSDDYVSSVVDALTDGRPDVVGWRHANTGTPGQFTDVSLAHANQPSEPVGGVYLRGFTHMNPVRSELARQGTFMSDSPGYTGEDLVFVRSVLPLLRQEFQLSSVVYTYQWSCDDSTQNGPEQPGPPHERPVIGSPCFRWLE